MIFIKCTYKKCKFILEWQRLLSTVRRSTAVVRYGSMLFRVCKAENDSWVINNLDLLIRKEFSYVSIQGILFVTGQPYGGVRNCVAFYQCSICIRLAYYQTPIIFVSGNRKLDKEYYNPRWS